MKFKSWRQDIEGVIHKVSRLANGQYVEAKKILQAHIKSHAEIIKRNIEHYNKKAFKGT